MSLTAPADPGQPSLRRALGRWDLTAIGVNQVIGGAIFLMPSQVAALIGNWSPLAFLLAGLASMLVALSFAEVGSRFEGTGGPYLYTTTAFGRFVGFEVGWMQWFTRATSQASITNGVVLATGFYWPAVTSGTARTALIVLMTATLAWINVLGIRQSAWVVNALTIGKLVPLFVFLVVGLVASDFTRLTELPAVTVPDASAAALLLIFVFGGFDVISVPAGETIDPRRQVPFAFVTTILVVTAVFTLAQAVCMAVLPSPAASTTPLADAAMLMLGAGGALLIGVGSLVSMSGNCVGQVLTGSRMLFALAEHRELPEWFARIHPRFHTPANAILFTSAVALVLSLSGSFAVLATASAVARLVTYSGASAAALALRRPRFEKAVQPPAFSLPLGPTIPLLAIAVSLVILAGASKAQLVGGLAALGAGAALFAVRQLARSSRA
jgi:amino acid transporter